MPRLPTPPAARQTAEARPTACEINRLCRMRARVSREDGHRRENAFAVPAHVLPRVLAVRRSQHVESAARFEVPRGGRESTAQPAPRAVPSIAAEAAPKEEARSGRRLRRSMRRLRLLDLC